MKVYILANLSFRSIWICRYIACVYCNKLKLEKKVILCQCRARRWIASRTLRRLKENRSAVILQRVARRFLSQKRELRAMCTTKAIKIQSFIRQLLARRRAEHRRFMKRLIRAQSYVRRYLAIKRTNERRRYCKAVSIQKIYRGFSARRLVPYMRRNRAAVVVQSRFRGYSARRRYNENRRLNKAVIIIQCALRCYRAHKKQRALRRHRLRREFDKRWVYINLLFKESFSIVLTFLSIDTIRLKESVDKGILAHVRQREKANKVHGSNNVGSTRQVLTGQSIPSRDKSQNIRKTVFHGNSRRPSNITTAQYQESSKAAAAATGSPKAATATSAKEKQSPKILVENPDPVFTEMPVSPTRQNDRYFLLCYCSATIKCTLYNNSLLPYMAD